MQKYLAEFVGTFLLVFIGTGSIVFDNQIYPIGGLGISLAFGGIVTIVILLFGKISGAHVNPAVSIALVFSGSLSKKKLPGYLIMQLAGALLASGVLFFLFPEDETLGASLPSISLISAFILELFLTFMLMLGIFICANTSHFLKNFLPYAIGFIVFMEAYLAGPLTGASMNPARSIAPLLFSGNADLLWLYTFAPITGAMLAYLFWGLLKKIQRLNNIIALPL